MLVSLNIAVWRKRMKSPDQSKENKDALYYSHKNSPIFDMIVIVGLIFNALIAIFVVLYWLDLL
jgi:hypothetical protein